CQGVRQRGALSYCLVEPRPYGTVTAVKTRSEAAARQYACHTRTRGHLPWPLSQSAYRIQSPGVEAWEHDVNGILPTTRLWPCSPRCRLRGLLAAGKVAGACR